MSDSKILSEVLRGGEFLVRDSRPEDIFIPEEFDEESLMIKQSVLDFIQNEIYPNALKLENQEDNIMTTLLEKAGELGILGAHIPEEYGGMPLHTNTNTLIAEMIGTTNSFSVAYAAHTGIGMLPILYFGTEEQRLKYLPLLATGKMKAAYCLTEPGSGSDALAAKTRADLSPDGEHYIINGQKMWITNAGFADVFIVFAKIDGDKFTGFIVERNTEGLSLGAEEHKMGIKGSSTRQVFFENMKVSKNNILGEIGKGHLIAFNVLNVGRFKLGVLTLGAAKKSFNVGVKYANERMQFGKSIASFGAIKRKLAEQIIKIFVLESAQYRVSNLLQHKVDALKVTGMSLSDAKLEAAEEYATECAMLKVFGSETLDFVVDETVQIHGGYGFSEEYAAARDYRDSRINRIFEGTNEINRLLMVDMIIKRAMKGTIQLTEAAWAVQKELAAMPSLVKPEGTYGFEIEALKNMKKALLVVAGAAVKWQIDGNLKLKEEQEILMNIADIATDVFAAESALLRVQKLSSMKTTEEMTVYDAILRCFFTDAINRVARNSNEALSSFVSGDTLKVMLMGIKRFTSNYPVHNTKDLRRIVADKGIEANQYYL